MREVYYEEELRYLKEEGARFAERYPRRAAHLNVESAKDRDPRVEALFEGFAFLCAGVRERVDAALPELASGLAGLVWPQLLHPIPALCVVEFRPRAGMLQGCYTVQKGTAMYADADPESGVCCRFATTQEVRVNPISVASAEAAVGAGGKGALTLTFKLEQGMRAEALSISPLRVFINDDLPGALLLRKMLLCHVEEVILRDDCGRSRRLDHRCVFAEGGFGEEEGLFPERQSVSRPLGLLRDYFAFPEKFLFIDIYGLDSLPSSGGSPARALSIEVRFDRKLSPKVSVSRDVFRLHCSPAANVFRRDAEPILVTGRKSEYDLVSDALRPDCFAVHSVISVTGVDGATGARRGYERYCRPKGGRQRFYSLRDCGAPDGGGARRMKLAMNGSQTESGRLTCETLHVEAWQTNGALARKVLTEGGALRQAAQGFPDYITFSNITKPSAPINPPEGDKYLWTFLSHLSCTYSNFGDAEGLKGLLRAYDWAQGGSGRPEVEAIRSVSVKPADLVVDRAVIRGAEMAVVVDEDAAPEEAFYLLGAVLARALSCMASINTFLKLTVAMPVSGRAFEWCCRAGERWAL